MLAIYVFFGAPGLRLLARKAAMGPCLRGPRARCYAPRLRSSPSEREPEGWPSGRRRTPGKCVCGKPYRGFESRPLRQPPVPPCVSKTHSPPQIPGFPAISLLHISLTFLSVSPSVSPRRRPKRTTERLNALQVKRLAEPGRYPDGGGLYLAVKPGGSKNWLYRFRTRWMGLGAFPTFSLSEARERAAAARQSCSSVLSREMFRWLKSAKARKHPINAKSRLDSVALNR